MTLGLLHIGNKFHSFTLEDERRMLKVPGETRIPSGQYEVTFNRTVTPKTEAYRQKFEWFDFHLVVKDVKGFDNIYIHIGNDDDDTDGCILCGFKADKAGSIEQSTPAFKSLYEKVSETLKAGEPVQLFVTDED